MKYQLSNPKLGHVWNSDFFNGKIINPYLSFREFNTLLIAYFHRS